MPRALNGKQNCEKIRPAGEPDSFFPIMASLRLGEAFQFDWSEEGLVIGSIYRQLQVSHMKLCASRAFSLVAYPSYRVTRCCSTPIRARSRPLAGWPSWHL